MTPVEKIGHSPESETKTPELTPKMKLDLASKVEGYEARRIVMGVIVSLETGHERGNKEREDLLKSARERFNGFSSKP